MTTSVTRERPLLLIGCGRMGSTMARGWLAGGLDPQALFAVEPAGPPDLGAPVVHFHALEQVPAHLNPAVAVLAVKPQQAAAVLEGLNRFTGSDALLVSMAAGVPLARLSAAVPAAVRAMPNTPAAIGRGITAAVASEAVSDGQRDLADRLLAATGEALWLDDERHLDAVTAVSGSGPAYVFALAETMAAAGVAQGLPQEVAARLARQTVIGAAYLLEESTEPPAELRRQVTSPGGTTEAALQVLGSEDGLQALMDRAVAAATARSRELGG